MTLQNDNIPTQIVPMVLYRMRDYLENQLVLNVPEEHPTRALLVKLGRFIENPVDKNVSVAICGGDYDDPNYKDGRIDLPDFDDLQLPFLPAAEVGGGNYWWRRGTVKYQIFNVRNRLPEDVSLQYAYDLQGRLIKAIRATPLNGLTDDYGEKAYPPVYVEGVTYFESGGNDRYIWRGKLFWRVLCWQP